MRGLAGFIDFSKDITVNKADENSQEIIKVMLEALRCPHPRTADYDADVRISKHYAFAFENHGSTECLRELNKAIFLYRDPMGLMPLFYTMLGKRLIFASAIGAILAYPSIEARLDISGLTELLALGPARYEHSGIFKDIYALPPGYVLKAEEENGAVRTTLERYWDFPGEVLKNSEAEIIANVRTLLIESVQSRLDLNRDNTCSMLSGGVDSSVISAIAAEAYRQAGKRLHTFSFDFKDSAAHFKANPFQPDRDRPWVEKMVDFCKSRHDYIECASDDLLDALYSAVDARDLPGMADVDASMLHFCSKIPKEFTAALTGECADEIFGGYPWFHRDLDKKDMIFPWSRDFASRKALLKDEWIEALKPEAAAAEYYNKTIKKYPGNPEDISQQRAYMTLKWFMPTLAERMNRMGWYSGLSAVAPFADIRLMEYVWAIPWELKRKDGMVKYVLREAARGIVPDEVLFRKKSPFPKTYDPAFTALLAERLHDILSEPAAPILDIIDAKKTKSFIETMKENPNLSRPWFGQLMAGPQMMAYMLQLDYWLRKYKVRCLW